jgi:antitoxin (DNA-binding transcriptional repressor) of toxin-antitoxin stability system
MNVKTADLKNNLSRYLRHIRNTGETILVCERDRPVATLSPLQRDDDAEWRRFREEAQARAETAGLVIEIPAQRPAQSALPRLTPTVAPDGRTDVQTSALLRQEKPY